MSPGLQKAEWQERRPKVSPKTRAKQWAIVDALREQGAIEAADMIAALLLRTEASES